MKLMVLNKKEIQAQIDRIVEFIDEEVDDGYQRCELHDMMEQLVITLKQNDVIEDFNSVTQAHSRSTQAAKMDVLWSMPVPVGSDSCRRTGQPDREKVAYGHQM